MAQRPVYVPILNSTSNLLYDEVYCKFQWFPGYSISQKRKSIESLHNSAKHSNIVPILEISSKSPDPVGVALSAFNLMINTDSYGNISVESVFQGSKIFSKGGPYKDFYVMSGREIKSDARLRESGNLIGFEFDGKAWGLEPKTAFYDWIYINALECNQSLKTQVTQFKGFTDIEFNPSKSINCQAKSCALYITLCKRNMIDKIKGNIELFIELLSKHYDIINKRNDVGNCGLFGGQS